MQNWSNVIPWVLTLCGLVFGVYQFREQQDQANRLPFLEQQLEACVEATNVTSALATETDPAEWEKQRALFWKLYWGRLALVEDRNVEGRMVEFGRAMPEGAVTKEMLPVKDLQVPSLNLALAARSLILESWNVEMRPLQGEEAKAQ